VTTKIKVDAFTVREQVIEAVKHLPSDALEELISTQLGFNAKYLVDEEVYEIEGEEGDLEMFFGNDIFERAT